MIKTSIFAVSIGVVAATSGFGLAGALAAPPVSEAADSSAAAAGQKPTETARATGTGEETPPGPSARAASGTLVKQRNAAAMAAAAVADEPMSTAKAVVTAEPTPSKSNTAATVAKPTSGDDAAPTDIAKATAQEQESETPAQSTKTAAQDSAKPLDAAAAALSNGAGSTAKSVLKSGSKPSAAAEVVEETEVIETATVTTSESKAASSEAEETSEDDAKPTQTAKVTVAEEETLVESVEVEAEVEATQSGPSDTPAANGADQAAAAVSGDGSSVIKSVLKADPDQDDGKEKASAGPDAAENTTKTAALTPADKPSAEQVKPETTAASDAGAQPDADAQDKTEDAAASGSQESDENSDASGQKSAALQDPTATPDTSTGQPPVSGATDEALGPPKPVDPVVAIVRSKITEYAGRANSDDVAAMTAFYEERTGPPIWVTDDGLTNKAKAAIAEIRKADDWGLNARAFDVPQLPAGNVTPEVAAETEIKMTVAVLKYARHARGGRIADPSRISKLLDRDPPIHPPKLVLTEITASETPDAYLRGLHPKHEQFVRLREVLLKLRGKGKQDEEEEEVDPALSVRLPPGGVLRPGMQDPQVALLRKRLKVPAAPGQENVYDVEVREAVLAFQRKNSLRPDAIVGNNTRTVLNGGTVSKPLRHSADQKIQLVLINMERWRWMPVDAGTFYVWDNVPEFLTRVVKNGRIIHTDKIVAGQPSWPTPSFSADMKSIVFHPSWGVPNGIKTKELAPLLRKSSGGDFFGIFGGGYSSQAVLDAHGLRAYYRGNQVDPNQVNWSSVDIRSFDFRQGPGPTNVLGQVKFMFPNKHDVYMHDTPERELFSRSFRGLSHGCMRVNQPRRLAEILLAEDKGWSAARVQSMFNGQSKDVALETHIPVHVTYLTARVDDNGKLHTYGDFYGLDARVGRALLGRSVQFQAPQYDDAPVANRQQYAPRQSQKKQYSGPPTLADAITDLFSP